MSFDGWSSNEFRMFDELNMPDSAFNDGFIQGWYDNIFFDFDNVLTTEDRADNLVELKNYLWDEYGLDYDEVFTDDWWTDYRELYDTAGA